MGVVIVGGDFGGEEVDELVVGDEGGRGWGDDREEGRVGRGEGMNGDGVKGRGVEEEMKGYEIVVSGVWELRSGIIGGKCIVLKIVISIGIKCKV